jgi:hypothetical protein
MAKKMTTDATTTRRSRAFDRGFTAGEGIGFPWPCGEGETLSLPSIPQEFKLHAYSLVPSEAEGIRWLIPGRARVDAWVNRHGQRQQAAQSSGRDLPVPSKCINGPDTVGRGVRGFGTARGSSWRSYCWKAWQRRSPVLNTRHS